MGILPRSVTAEIAALSRALGALDPRLPEPCGDELAHLVVSPVSRAVLSRTLLRIEARRALERFAPGLYAWHVLRTSYFDTLVRDAVRSGARQLVVLGAGLDTRAVRLCAHDTPLTIFEVDRSPQAAEKAAVLVEATGRTPDDRIVRTDLSGPSTSLADDLIAHGFELGAPTFVLCEGLLMYLTLDEIDLLLADVASLSSRLTFAFDFVHDTALEQTGDRTEAGRMLRSASLVGETYRSGFAPAEIGAHLAARGFELLESLDGEGLAQRVWRHERAPYSISSCSSVCHAIRAADDSP